MSNTIRILLGLLAGAAAGLLLAWLMNRAWGLALRKRFCRTFNFELQAAATEDAIVLSLSTSHSFPLDEVARYLHSNSVRDVLVQALLDAPMFGLRFRWNATTSLALLPRDPVAIEKLRAAIPAGGSAPAPVGFGDWFAGVIPVNAIAAAAQSAMLPLVVFALFFGFALTRIEAARRERMIEFFQAIADTMIVIVRWVLWAAPLGVFALIFAVCAHAGAGVLSALGGYIAMQCVTYAAMTLLLYPVAIAFGGEAPRRWIAGLLPPQVVAASTQSSLASLPAMLESARDRLGHPRAVSALVLPMAVSLFRLTSPMQYIGAASFVAWIYGVDVPLAQLAIATALAVVLSLGAVGLPGQVSFMAATMPVTSTMGLPVEPLGLLLAVDTVPDVFATVGNVTGDLTANSLVARGTRDEAE